tara:strand:- start:1026 stop:1433 length:408 start_codon:yes stop_codon:yes gene_type:complete
MNRKLLSVLLVIGLIFQPVLASAVMLISDSTASAVAKSHMPSSEGGQHANESSIMKSCHDAVEINKNSPKEHCKHCAQTSQCSDECASSCAPLSAAFTDNSCLLPITEQSLARKIKLDRMPTGVSPIIYHPPILS